MTTTTTTASVVPPALVAMAMALLAAMLVCAVLAPRARLVLTCSSDSNTRPMRG